MTSVDPQLFRSLVEHAPVMLCSTRPDGRCEHVNAAWLGFTGRALADETGDGWLSDFHPDDVHRVRRLHGDHVARREPFDTECRLRRHDGQYRAFLLRGTPRIDRDGQLVGFVASCSELGSAGDVPGQGEIFERLLDHVCVAGFDGYWKWLTPSWTRSLGWSAEELMSRPLIDFVHPDDRAATLGARDGLKEGAPLLALTNRYRRTDGTYRWFEWRSVSDLDRQLVYAVARDVTAEQDARRLQRDLTASLTAILNSIADGLIATDREARVTQMNPVAERLTGWTAREALGKPVVEVVQLVRADARAAEEVVVERTLQEGIASQGSEDNLLVARDGTARPIAFSRAPMRDQLGTVIGAVLLFRDMTAERQAQEVQEQLQRQLVLADRMASVGTLAAGVAHEINNPLAYVMANLDMILEDLRGLDSGAPRDQLAEWIEMATDARNGAERIRKIVRGLKTFSRADEERPVIIEVIPTLDHSIDLAFNEIRHRARLRKDYGPTPPVLADESRLRQVFINLLVNAAQALPDDGADHNEIRVVTATDGSGRAVVEVLDSGPGIPEDVIGRIFDPFFTTKPVGLGTGLGLAICHTIVTSMGGEITVHNRPEGGAGFRITLAPSTSAGSPSASEPRADRAAPEQAVRVLVVDDERTVGATLARVLRGHQVTALTSAREALDLLATGAHFDLVLSDVMMPEMSGMEFYDELSRRYPALARTMVFITGGAFTPSASSFLERVPNPRLEKPFDPAVVRQLVEQLRR